MTTRGIKPARGDAGVTLVELLVVMALMGVVGSLVMSWFVAMTRNISEQTSRVTDAADARYALEYLSKDLRMAIRPRPGTPAFTASSSDRAVEFYVNVPRGVPALVRYSVQTAGGGNQQLVREYTPAAAGGPPYSWPSSGTKRLVLVPRLDPADGFRLSYTTASEADLPPCSSTVTTGCALPLPASPSLTSRDFVGAVEAMLHVVGNPLNDTTTRLRTRVLVVNADETAIVE